MKKYIAIIDYKAGNKNFGHAELNSKTIIEAMDEAQKLKTDCVYLVKIAEKTGRTENAKVLDAQIIKKFFAAEALDGTLAQARTANPQTSGKELNIVDSSIFILFDTLKPPTGNGGR